MKVLIDTNVLLDVFLKREPFFENSARVIDLCLSEVICGYIAAFSVPTLWYVLKNEYSATEKRMLIKSLLEYVEVLDIGKEKILCAVNRSDFVDFEDCLQDECAYWANLDCIITRNTKDFAFAKVPAITPADFIANGAF